MPNRTTIKVFVTLIFAFSALLHFIMVRSHNEVVENQDLNEMKVLSTKPTQEKLVRTHKLSPPFTANITSDVRTPILVDSQFTLTASIETTQNFNQVEYEWMIPDSVELIGASSQKGLISNFNNKSSHQLDATFHLTTHENRIISLKISSKSSSGNLVRIINFHTSQQDALVAKRDFTGKRHKEYLANNPESLKKLK